MADFGCRLSIRRKMYVMPLALIQTGCANGFYKSLWRAVVKQFKDGKLEMWSNTGMCVTMLLSSGAVLS